ncbi:MAG: hypothetical protein ACJAVM_000159 [Sulfitobacter sp.]|jgi:hypothetical protein
MWPWRWGNWVNQQNLASLICPCHIGADHWDDHNVTNRLAIIIGSVLITTLLLDMIIFGMEHVIFLTKKFTELIEWIAFWR